MGYKRDVIKGISWLSFFRVLTRIISFLRTAIIARILSPSQFGIYGIAVLILALVEMLTETGINIFLIQRKDSIDRYIDTAWVISIVRGLVISIVMVISAPFIASFYQAELLTFLIYIASLIPFIRGFINPSIAKFIKELQFKKEFIYRTSIFVVESTISLIMVYLLQSPSGLIYGLITGALYEVLLSFVLISPRPKLNFQFVLFREVIDRGKWFTASGVLNYLYHHGDDAVVGKMVGTGGLGLYDMAYRISLLPITEVSDIIVKTTFPIYVKMGNDLARMKKAYLKSVLLVSMVVIPAGIIVFLFPKQIISIVLGEKWIGAASVLQVLTIFGVIRAITHSFTAPLFALDKQEIVAILAFVSLMGMGITIVPFINMWGIVGAGYSALLGTIVSVPLIFYFVNKLFSTSNIQKGKQV